ncbi:hypothetical protein V2O64_06750 [Verrucomicrobiaceae bacterium 227]
MSHDPAGPHEHDDAENGENIRDEHSTEGSKLGGLILGVGVGHGIAGKNAMILF